MIPKYITPKTLTTNINNIQQENHGKFLLYHYALREQL